MNDVRMRLGNRWRLWDQFAVRGAGFPVAGVLRLAPDGLAVAADRVDLKQLTGPRWKEFQGLFGEAAVKTATVLQEVAASSSFRTAVTWQNRAVMGSAIRPFLAWLPTVSSRTTVPRQREELVAQYWQRFCVKNDTIGFFGPVGWGRFDPTGRSVRIDTGEGLIESSELYFSSWAVDTLAGTIDADPRLREWTAPRRVPYVRVGHDGATLPGRPPQPLAAHERAVLLRCDGTCSARDLQQELGQEVDVAAVLTGLVGRRLVSWQLEVPADARPERYLRAWLERVGDGAARERGLGLLDGLERGRDRLGSARDPDELSAAMAAMETEFAEVTETAGARRKGTATAPCRALVYSDCRRAGRVRLGPDVLAAMNPLASLLTSATWLTSELAARVMSRARRVFDDLVAQTGEDDVDLATFWFACMPILHRDAAADVADVQLELQRRWAEILGPLTGRRVTLSEVDVAARVAAAFDARGPGWTAARYISPDLLIAAPDTAAVERGDFELVLGELHLAANTMGASLYLNQHPAPEELFRLTDEDHPRPRLLPLVAKENKSRLSVRVRHSLVRKEDYCVALVDSTADPCRPRTVRSADVRVRVQDERLVAVLPDGAVFDVVDAFGHVLTTLAMDSFRPLPERDRSPRVTIGRLVVARETWRWRPAELPFADEKNEARRFVRARRWFAAQDLPRFVFVTSPAEQRPLFVDFESPVYVNILAKAARRLARKDPAAPLVVTEMLPTPDQCWLTDDQGNRYTAELRFVVADQQV